MLSTKYEFEFVRLRQEMEGYVELGQRLRCACIADIVY